MKKLMIIIVTTLFFGLLVGCGSPKQKYYEFKDSDQIKLVATTTMMGDLARAIGGNKVIVHTMMPSGVDPHTYNPNKLDIDYLLSSNIVLISGLHLEAKAGEAIKQVQNRNIDVIEATQILVSKHQNNHEDGVKLINWVNEENGQNELYDPHFWFDVDYWIIVSKYFTEEISKLHPEHELYFQTRYQNYLLELEALNYYVKTRINEVPESKRILFTAHDAFHYFGIKYGFEVAAVQGISTEHEASTSNIENLVNLAIQKQVTTVFIETSVPRKTIESIIESAESKNHSIKIGGELLSDSLGNYDDKGNTYINMIKDNIDTIVDAIINN